MSRSRPTHREIEERFALRAPTPNTNGCLDTCNLICKRRRARWTRKTARRRQTEGGRETSFYCLPFLLLDWFVGGTASQDPIRQSTNPCRVTWQRGKRRWQRTSYKRESEQPCTYAAHAKKFFSNSKKSSHHYSSVMSSSEQILCVFPREKCLSTRISPLRAEALFTKWNYILSLLS